MWKAIEQSISEATGEAFTVLSAVPVSGGCINEAVCLTGEKQRFFVKLNHAEQAATVCVRGRRAYSDSRQQLPARATAGVPWE